MHRILIKASLPILLLFCFFRQASAEYGAPRTEKGDAIFRDFGVNGFGWLGHAGVYDYWNAALGDSSGAGSHIIMDAMTDGVHVRSFAQFLGEYSFWGSFTPSRQLTAEQRRNIISAAKTQEGVPYNFFAPLAPNESFRCDGFVEWVYDQVGEGFFTDEEVQQYLTTFTPDKLRDRMLRDALVAPPVIQLSDVNGEILPPTMSANATTVSIHVTEDPQEAERIPVGSGLALLEIWNGSPDSGGVLLNSIDQKYDVSHTYTATELGALTTGQIYVRAYDQAGNYSTTNFTVSIPTIEVRAGTYFGAQVVGNAESTDSLNVFIRARDVFGVTRLELLNTDTSAVMTSTPKTGAFSA